MSEIKILSYKENLIEEVASLLVTNGELKSNAMVVFPGKRPAFYLRKLLAERLNSSYFPPLIYSIDAFIEYIYRDILDNKKNILSTWDAVAILYDLHLKFEQRLGNESYSSLDSFLPIGIKLYTELEEILLANLPTYQIREILSAIQIPPNYHTLIYYYEKFYDEVEKQNFTTRSMMYRTVAEQIGKINFDVDVLILAGFFAFTNVEKTIVKNLKERDNVVLIFQNGIGLTAQLEKLGIKWNNEAEINSSPEINFIKTPDSHGQVFALSAILDEQLKQGKKFSIETAIVLPSSELLFPLYHHVLSLFKDDDYNISLQYPINRTPVFSFLNSLMELTSGMYNGKFSAKEYLQFILHPYTKNIRYKNSSEITRMIFHIIEDYLVENRSLMLFSLDDLEADKAMFIEILNRIKGVFPEITYDALREHIKTIHNNTIRKFVKFTSLKNFAECVIEVLDFIFSNSTASLHPYFRPYVQYFMELLDELRTSLLAEYHFNEPIGYFTFLRSIVTTKSVPFLGTPLRGVQVLGLLETRNIKFENLFILDVNDDVVPGKPKENLLLPQKIRAVLGLETYHDAEKLMEYYFDIAVNSAKNVWLFYTESSTKEKSRFVEKLLWHKQQIDRTPTIEKYENVVKYRVKLINKIPDPIQKNDQMIQWMKKNLVLSAYALDTYLDCQLKFYYEIVLRLKEKETAEEDVDAKGIGSLVHKILKEYFLPLCGEELVKDDLAKERLMDIINNTFSITFGNEVSGAILLMRKQIEQRLWEFIQYYQIPIIEREKVEILEIEKVFRAEKNGYWFKGTIDRIEQRGDKFYIIDYKTSANDSAVKIRLNKLNPDDFATWGNAIQSFQLPLYMFLYCQNARISLNSVVPVYIFLGKNSVDEEIEVLMSDSKISPVELFNSVEPYIFKIVEQIHNPEIPFAPTQDTKKHCPRCLYKLICGSQWIRDQRNF